MLKLLTLLVLTVLHDHLAFGQNAPCETYDDLPILPYMAERVVGYQLEPGQYPISDRFLSPGWYRMGSYVLTSSKVTCGTTLNWYRIGSLSSDTSTVTVCRNDGTECATLKQIEVRRCGENYVFNLQPLGIDNAYCIESLTGDTGNIPAPDISKMPSPPTIIVKGENPRGLVHYCEFIPADASLLYQVEWSQTSKLSKYRLLQKSQFMKYEKTPFRASTALTEETLIKHGIMHVGYTIICTVKAITDIAGQISKPVDSQPYFCGFEVEPRGTIQVKSHEHTEISIRKTFPLACINGANNQPTNCPLYVFLNIPTKSENCKAPKLRGAIRDTMACGVRLESNFFDWKNITVQITDVDINFKYATQYGVFLTSEALEHPFLEAELPPIRIVAAVDNSMLDNKLCYAHSDPHFKTFDEKLYDVHQDGTYVLYRNARYRQEVQIRLGKCPTWATHPISPYCVEAVAIAAGKDVFIVDPKVPKIGFRLCEDAVLHRKITRLGDKAFKIQLPTGTWVNIETRTFADFLEVDIYPSLPDWKTCDGLCGNFDQNSDNDANVDPKYPFLLEESTLGKWRVTSDKQNLFSVESNERLFPWDNTLKVCECIQHDINVEANDVYCKAEYKHTCDEGKNNVVLQCDLARKKRGNSDIHQSTTTNFFSHNKPLLHKRFAKSITDQGLEYDESSARKECARILNTTLTQMCMALPNFNINSYIDNCVTDVMLSGSIEWALIHLEGLKTSCIHYVEFNQPIPPEVRQNLSASVDWMFNDTDDEATNNTSTLSTTTILPITTTEHNPAFSPEILESIKDIACPGDCNGRGACVKGECQCEDDYFDIDCGQDIKEPPVMVGIPDLGLCDLTKRECAVTSVLGRNFIRTTSLSCKLVPYEITSEGHITDQPVVLNGSLVTYVEVKCQLPVPRDKRSTTITDDDRVARGYRVSVSNDGSTFCEEDPIVIYDSTCVNCSKHEGIVSCFKLPGFCMQNGRCVEPGQTHACRTCHIDGNGNAEWNPRAECEDPMSPPDSKLWIIGAVIGSLVVLAAVITVTYWIMLKKGVDRRKKMGSVNPIMGTQIEKIN